MTQFNRNELKTKTMAQFRPAAPVAQEDQASAPENEMDDDFEEDSSVESSSFLDKFKLIMPIIIIAIICFLAYAWYTDKFAISNAGGDIPVVKAVQEPLREKPEDPGGLKIINRDKQVYETISGQDSDKNHQETNLLPAPEEPISHDEIVTKAAPELISKLPVQENVVKDKEVAVKPNETRPVTPIDKTTTQAPLVAEKQTAPIANVTKDTGVVAPNAVKETAVLPVAIEKDTKIKAVTAENVTDIAPAKQQLDKKKVQKIDLKYRVQLGSYRSTGDASSSWKALKKKFPSILVDMEEYVEKAVVGEKGTFYRLQIAGFKNEADARKICQKLTEKKQGCFFVGK